MSDLLDVTCPNCATPLKVPVKHAGKKVKCKKCQQVLAVPDVPAPAAAPAKPEEYMSPAQKRHAQDEEDEHGPKDYGVIKGDDSPRCPHCAKELDPPDSKICLHCGYNTLERKRHESRKIYKATFGDWVMHLGPAVLCILAAAGLLSGAIYCWANMEDWLAGTIIESDEKNPVTGKNITYVKPWCFSLWIFMVALWVSYKLGKFGLRRFVYYFRPPERVKR